MNGWAYLPLSIDPVAFSIGSFSFRWYSIGWMIGFFVAYFVLRFVQGKSFENKQDRGKLGFDESVGLFFGALLGGRIGFAVLYMPEYFLEHPLRLFFPFDSGGNFVGLSGMSFFGGLIGVILALHILFRGRQRELFQAVDFLALSAPVAIFFGRLGNFLNGELYGRPTDFFLGMYFRGNESLLRHPSQLYEAFFEGGILFWILFFLWKKKGNRPSGTLAGYFLVWYGLFRFFLEYVREPGSGEVAIFQSLTLGQVYAVLTVICGGIFLFSRKNGTISVLDSR